MENLRINYLITADQVISDDSTAKFSIIGIFDKIYASLVPAIHPKFSLIVNLTGIEGKEYGDLSIDIINEKSQKSIANAKQKEIKFTNGNKLSLIVDFSNALFTDFCHYTIKIIVGGKILTEKDYYVSVEQK